MLMNYTEQAKAIMGRVIQALSVSSESPEAMRYAATEDVAAALQAAAGPIAEALACKGIVDCSGAKAVVRQVLGTLPVTADGAVVGEDAAAWRDKSRTLTGQTECRVLCLCWGVDQTGNGIRTLASSWWSTREAAEAGRNNQ